MKIKSQPNTQQKTDTYPKNVNDADSRRSHVKRILLGVGVVGAVQYWTKPIIESAVLPSHGQNTAPSAPPPPPPPPAP